MIDAIRDKIDGGERLAPADALYLLHDAPLLEVGALANDVRFQRHPKSVVSYVLDTNLNYTNVCDVYCNFCAFYRPHRGKFDDAYTHTIEDLGGDRDRCSIPRLGAEPYEDTTQSHVVCKLRPRTGSRKGMYPVCPFVFITVAPGLESKDMMHNVLILTIGCSVLLEFSKADRRVVPTH